MMTFRHNTLMGWLANWVPFFQKYKNIPIFHPLEESFIIFITFAGGLVCCIFTVYFGEDAKQHILYFFKPAATASI